MKTMLLDRKAWIVSALITTTAILLMVDSENATVFVATKLAAIVTGYLTSRAIQ